MLLVTNRTFNQLFVGAGIVAGVWIAGTAAPRAQQARAAAALTTLQVAPHLIAGDGGNIVVQSGPDGLVVIDSGAGRRSTDVLAAIKAISPAPIRYVINTSADADHVGGNAEIAAAGEALGGGNAPAVFGGVRTGAARLGHENVLLRMSKVTGDKPAFPEADWPTEGFVDSKNLYLNGEAIQLFHQPAVTDSDSIIFFRRSDVIVAGHIIDTRRFPVIDVANGGSIQGEIDALNRLVQLAVPPTPLVWQEGGTRVIPGHGHVMEQADVLEYRDMVTIVRDVVQDLMKKGMTLEQIRRAEPTKGYTRHYGAESARAFVDAIHASLTKGAAR
jgi:cyclase